MDMTFEEHEVLEDATGLWWLFLITGIGWLVFALLVFQWDYTTVYAISILFGFVAIIAGIKRVRRMGVWTTGWKIVHGIVGVLFLVVGDLGPRPSHTAFTTLAALVGLLPRSSRASSTSRCRSSRRASSTSGGCSSSSGSSSSCSPSGSRGASGRGCDPARRLRRDHRADAGDHRALRRVQAQVDQEGAAPGLTV